MSEALRKGAHPWLQGGRRQVELVACADVNVERARQVAEAFGFRPGLRRLPRDAGKGRAGRGERLHAQQVSRAGAIAALEAGCHVLCEKPPALTAAEARLMVETAARVGKVLTFGLHYRFSTEVQAAKRIIDGGETRAHLRSPVDAIRRRGIPGMGRLYQQRAPRAAARSSTSASTCWTPAST